VVTVAEEVGKVAARTAEEVMETAMVAGGMVVVGKEAAVVGTVEGGGETVGVEVEEAAVDAVGGVKVVEKAQEVAVAERED
jgi:hypothetical protein